MSCSQISPDPSVWTKYFFDQLAANGKGSGVKSKVSDSANPIGGGVSAGNTAVRLSTVGKVKDLSVKGHPDNVKVQITSPAEATVEQAESELKNIKAEKQHNNSSERHTTEVKARAKKRRVKPVKKSEAGKAKKKKSTTPHKDIFSK